jgi:hypothetical protein
MARVLKPGGIVSFLTITITPGLTDRQRRRAIELGDPEDEADPGYEVMLREAGFIDRIIEDVTPTYADTLARLTQAWLDDSKAIRAVVGSEEFANKIDRRKRSLTGIAEGLHQRVWITGQTPYA